MTMSFNTIEFINKAAKQLDASNYERDYKVLDRVCKKIDVVKRVYIKYEGDLSKAKSTEEINVNDYEILLKILLNYSKNDLKYFNSGLKLYDKIKNQIDTDKQNEIKQKIASIFGSVQ